MEVVGRIKMIDTVKEVGSAGFKKRDLVVTTDEQYPQFISIQFVQDKCDLLNAFQINDNVKVDINLRGREWVNKEGETVYFNSIQGWRISKVMADGQASSGQQAPPIPASEAFAPATNLKEEDHDDLPF